MLLPYSMLELSSATSSQISGFIEDMSQIHGASSLRARYVNRTDANGQRANVLVLFVRTDKDPLVERMISFFDKTAQNHLAVMELQKRIPGLLQTAPDAAGAIVELPGAITVNEAAEKVKALNAATISAVCSMLQTAATAFKPAQGNASVRSAILSRGCAGMLWLAGQASYEHDMRLVRQRLGVGTHVSEGDFSRRFYSFAIFASMLSTLISNRDAELADRQGKGIDTGSTPKPISAAGISDQQRQVIDEGLEFCRLWISATDRKAASGRSTRPGNFQSVQGWAIGEIACIAAPLVGHAGFSGQALPASLYGISDLAPALPQRMNNGRRRK